MANGPVEAPGTFRSATSTPPFLPAYKAVSPDGHALGRDPLSTATTWITHPSTHSSHLHGQWYRCSLFLPPGRLSPPINLTHLAHTRYGISTIVRQPLVLHSFLIPSS